MLINMTEDYKLHLKRYISYRNGTALAPEKFWWKTARWPALVIWNRKLSINIATIKGHN